MGTQISEDCPLSSTKSAMRNDNDCLWTSFRKSRCNLLIHGCIFRNSNMRSKSILIWTKLFWIKYFPITFLVPLPVLQETTEKIPWGMNPNRFAFSAPFLKRTGSTRIAHLPLQFIPAFSRRAIKEALIVLPCPYDSDCVCPWEPYWIRDKYEQKIFLHIQNKSINIYLWRKKKGMAQLLWNVRLTSANFRCFNRKWNSLKMKLPQCNAIRVRTSFLRAILP